MFNKKLVMRQEEERRKNEMLRKNLSKFDMKNDFPFIRNLDLVFFFAFPLTSFWRSGIMW